MKKTACLVNYNHDPKDWWLEYGYKPEDVTLYDRSDDGIQRTFAAKTYRTENIGNVDRDKLGFLIEQYDTLPDVFLWSKTNLFKYISKEEWEEVKDNERFTPLLTQNHKTYMDNTLPGGGWNTVSAYIDKMYYERSGIVSSLQKSHAAEYYRTWEEWCAAFQIPVEVLIPFPPGGSFLLTREKVHRYSRDFYSRMRDTLGHAQLPVEAFLAERSYYLLWR